MLSIRLAKITFGILIVGIVGCSELEACQTSQCEADAKITAQVRDRIEKSSAALGLINVGTEDGIVYLHGPVDTSVESSVIESLAHGPGVKEVVNDLYLR